MTETKIKGLFIIENFISEEEESFLLECISKPPLLRGKVGRNSVQRYGSNAPYQNQILNKKIPGFFHVLIDKLIKYNWISGEELPDSVSVNQYFPGNSIDLHVDSPQSGPVISVVSLLGSCKMHFSNIQSGFFAIDFPRRALVQIRDEARWNWKHGIPNIQEPRYSIVLRKGTRI